MLSNLAPFTERKLCNGPKLGKRNDGLRLYRKQLKTVVRTVFFLAVTLLPCTTFGHYLNAGSNVAIRKIGGTISLKNNYGPDLSVLPSLVDPVSTVVVSGIIRPATQQINPHTPPGVLIASAATGGGAEISVISGKVQRIIRAG
jgi:hypothetical protein